MSTLSIGTALAIEAYVKEKKTQTPFLLVNVRTVLRNLMESVEKDVLLRVKAEDLATVLLDELAFIHRELPPLTGQVTQVQFYYPTYSDLQRILPYAELREITTPAQKFQVALEQHVFAHLQRQKTEPWERVATRHPGLKQATTILTHSPCDLLAKPYFPQLQLLESHTGAIKGYTLWHTKYTNGKELDCIPFGRFGLQIFGDNNTLLKQKPFKVKQLVLGMAKADHWTSMSSDDRIRASINKHKDPVERMMLLKVLTS
jgi:hypothetical protein